MGSRGLVLVLSVMVCAFACVMAFGALSAVAATQFGTAGGEAGQLRSPTGVAADAAGNVYIGDTNNRRVDRFDRSGVFQFASGWGVATGAFELQTCVFSCREGLSSQATDPSSFEFAEGLAVDDAASSPSYGDVYVTDAPHNRVEKFRLEEQLDGKVLVRFVSMIGGHVNKANGGNLCLAGEECAAFATTGTADGEFSYWISQLSSFVAVGPAGRLYVGDEGRVQVFEPSGVWRENISLAGLSSEGRPTALAVDSNGDVLVKDEGVAGVHELEPNGTEKAVSLDAASTSVTALAVDPSGDLFIGDSSGGFHVLEYDATGNELASFGAGTVKEGNYGIAFSPVTNELYAPEGYCVSKCYVALAEQEIVADVWALPVPPPGPVVETESATSGLRGNMTLEALINPENHETTYHFEYVDEHSYQSGAFTSATSTTSASIGSGFEDRSVSASLTGLIPGETYHYRAVAEDSLGRKTLGPDHVVQATPPAYIEGPWAVSASSTSVTLQAQINPLGAETTYRWEWGTSASYGHVFSASAGEGTSFMAVSHHVQELEPDTTYHYRLVTTSSVGTVQSADRTFTTQLPGGELSLPDGRAWELVSPANKKGALIEPSELQSTGADGRRVAYIARGPSVTDDPTANDGIGSSVLASRTPEGWVSQDITPPREQGVNGFNLFDVFGQNRAAYGMFSADLSSAVLDPGGEGYDTPLLSPEATENTLYIRDNSTGNFRPLVTAANVPPGTEFGGALSSAGVEPDRPFRMKFVTATRDLSHVVLESPEPLTSDAPPLVRIENCSFNFPCGLDYLYEWSAGRLQLASILPNGEPVHELPFVFVPGSSQDTRAVRLNAQDAISDDGRWIVWDYGSPYDKSVSSKGLYVRDMFSERTMRVGGTLPFFQAMSRDGSKVFYREHGELYVFDTSTETATDLTPVREINASVKEAVLGISEDGSYVYFIGTGVLAPGGVHGEDNLYVAHDDGNGWSTTFVASLSSQDEGDWAKTGNQTPPAARVSPDGRYVTFMSARSLTGYDNLDSVSGQPDEEVFLYDASSGRTACVSCDPSGVRPAGAYDNSEGFEAVPLVDRTFSWRRHWLAANIPTSYVVSSQPRSVFDDGRVFFNSYEGLVPQDTNGLTDVYEYEPAGVGDCTSASATLSGRSGGCVGLITSGQSSTDSAFFDASATGDDAFFFASSKLVSADYDTSYDIYDAHVCSASAPCNQVPVSPPACTSGDSCKAAPSPQPTLFGPAPSATFSGKGNLTGPSKQVVRHRSLTRLQRLARALRACRHKRGVRRAVCERRARRRYGPGHARKSNASAKGNG